MTTGTQTTTFTIADVRRVVNNFGADYFMIAQSTGLRSRTQVEETVADLTLFADEGYLLAVVSFPPKSWSWNGRSNSSSPVNNSWNWNVMP